MDMNDENIVCGIDEAGRGPVIGPMVMSLVCGDGNILKNLGVKDSKLLSRRQREILYEKIMSVSTRIEHVVISAQDLNASMNVETLNEIELSHAVKLAGKAGDKVVVDCFDVNEARASSRMSRESGKEVTCVHKADRDYAAVSAASIISKVIRDREIDRIVEKYGDVGSGYPSDPKTRAFLEESLAKGMDLSGIVRTHWKTYKDIKRKSGYGKLF